MHNKNQISHHLHIQSMAQPIPQLQHTCAMMTSFCTSSGLTLTNNSFRATQSAMILSITKMLLNFLCPLMLHTEVYIYSKLNSFQNIKNLNKNFMLQKKRIEISIFYTFNNSEYPNRYFEFEVSPSGQLFFADISNPNLNCSSLGTYYYPCTSATYQGKVTQKGWEGYLKIDLSIIGRGRKYDFYKGNLYRIDKYKSKPTRYLAFNPALNSPACFHQPLKFVDFQLV